jgi:putative transposase
MVFHVLNRGVGRMKLFFKDGDYEAFERTLENTLEARPMRLLGYCVMPNHWHLLLWPERDGDLGAFMQKLSITQVRNWQEHRRRVGYGHIYQGRYKSFAVQTDEHYYQVVRYVERNALRAKLVERAEDWRWGSVWRRVHGSPEQRQWLSAGPLSLPKDWTQLVNRPQSEAEVQALRHCVLKSRPYGGDRWVKTTAKRLNLESSLRPRGRPKGS